MKRRKLRTFTKWLTRFSGLTLLSCLALWWGLPRFLRLPPRLLNPPALSPLFLASDGSPIQQLLNASEQRQEDAVELSDLSPHLIQAILSAEDKNFYRHGGIDFFAILRATRDNLKTGRTVSGASTLTQQLIKISSDPKTKRNLRSKIREAFLARALELTWSKDQILTAYMNRVDFGQQWIGISAASSGYFSKKPSDLSLAESSLLASLPQNPTRLNPYRSPERLRTRQHRILNLMLAQGRIETEAHDGAKMEPWLLRRYEAGFYAPHLVEMLKTQLDKYQNQPIRTTLDLELQRQVSRVVERQLQSLTQQNVRQAAVVVIENSSGKVRVLMGSRDFYRSDQGQINGAWMAKSAGSALKPFTYLMALEQGQSPSRIIPDLPVEYATPTGTYRPENYHRQHQGPVTLRQALGNSLNIPAVRLLHEMGGEAVLKERLEALGIRTLHEESRHYGLGLTLGNAPVRLLELTNAYAALARLGQFLPYRLLEEAPAASPRVVSSPEATFVLADMLQDARARAWTFGNHSVLNFDFPCAVKTGTSTDYRDNWALGYTPEFTVGVWVGNFDNSAMHEVSGVTGAGPILREIFLKIREKHALSWFKMPAGLERRWHDLRLGKVVSEASRSPHVQEDYFYRHLDAPVADPTDYSEQGRLAYLDPEYSEWHARSDSPMVRYTAIRPQVEAASSAPTIEFPQHGAVYYLDPDLPDGGRKMRLRVAGKAALQWRSDTLKFSTENEVTYAWLKVGVHEISAHHAGGDTVVKFEVKSLAPP